MDLHSDEHSTHEHGNAATLFEIPVHTGSTTAGDPGLSTPPILDMVSAMFCSVYFDRDADNILSFEEI